MIALHKREFASKAKQVHYLICILL